MKVSCLTPSKEAGVGNASDLTQSFHYGNSFLPEIHIVLIYQGLLCQK